MSRADKAIKRARNRVAFRERQLEAAQRALAEAKTELDALVPRATAVLDLERAGSTGPYPLPGSVAIA